MTDQYGDRALWGYMRWGHFRWGVYTLHWSRFQNSIEKKIRTPGKMLVDGTPAKVDEGEWRVDGFTPYLWDAFKKGLENV